MELGLDGWPEVGGVSNGVAIWLLRAVADSVKTVVLSELLAASIRGALLIDLRLAGRVQDGGPSLAVDTAKTGFGPADAVVAAIEQHPPRTMQIWLQRGHPHASVVADVFVERGEWTRKHREIYRRYAPTEQAVRDGTIRRQLAGYLQQGSAPNPTIASLIRIAAPVGLFGRNNRYLDPPARIVAACGHARELVDAVVDYLRAAEVDEQTGAAMATEANVFGGGG